jgi:hypothetical protein
MLTDNMLSYIIMLSDNIVLSDSMLSYFIFLETPHTQKHTQK